jgi:thiol-disulfide isomerase/thioredoxin
MARTLSEMVPLGTAAPYFDLPIANPGVDDKSGSRRSLDDFAEARALVVVFSCNHCPYVHSVEPRLIQIAREYQERGVAFVLISANDADQYPADSFDEMAKRAQNLSYPFPYLYDETQEVAEAYRAVCTPDFFVFDQEQKLAYRGRMDDGRPGQYATTQELKDALDSLLAGREVPGEQLASIGCSIKWRY